MCATKRARRLRPGDTVAVVAPSGPVDAAGLERGLATLRGWGLDVVVGDHVTDRHPTLDYLAGADADRAADLEAAWCDPAVAAVFCARGGYGAMRVIDLVDWEAMAAAGPKVFAGSSDITALHAAINHRLRLPTLFTPMLATAAFDDVAAGLLRDALFGADAGDGDNDGPGDHNGDTVITSDGVTIVVGGTATGTLAGGNLALLAAGLGARNAPPHPTDAIVVLEDVDEEPYRLDRMLVQLRRAGWFDGVAGIVLGTWTGCGEPAEVDATVTAQLAELGVPLVANVRFGHCAGQLTLPLGVRATLDADSATVTVHEPALA